jgi:hypothetical protein
VQDNGVYGLSWGWIALMAASAPLVALPVAWLAWRESQMILGNLAGTAVIFAGALAVITRERVEIDRFQQACVEAGVLNCLVDPSPFTRFAVYSFVALFEVIALFLWSLRVERRQRNRRYAPEWRV